MLTLIVSPCTKNTWLVQLYHYRIPLNFNYCNATCKEHAEAAACSIFPQATLVNGINV